MPVHETLLLAYPRPTVYVGWGTETMMNEQNDFRIRRSRFHLIGEILDIATAGVSKTRIMYKANLSASMTKEYIELLKEINLLEVSNERGRAVYKTNDRGFQYLNNYKLILQMLCDETQKGVQPNIKGGPVTYWVEKTPQFSLPKRL